MKSPVLFILFATMVSSVRTSDMSARQIMVLNDSQGDSRDSHTEFTMKLINSKGKERSRTVVQYSATNDTNRDKSLIKFLSPANIKGVGLLSIEEEEGDNQWLYLPATKKVRRISSSQKTDNFMGSDFTYEDIQGNDIDDFSYTLLGDDTVDGKKCYIIESRPTSESLIEETLYSRMILWIDMENYTAVKIEFYNKKNEKIKIMKSSDFRRIPGTDKWRAYNIVMKNLKSGHKTELIYEVLQIDQGIEEKYFSLQFLRKG